MTGHQSWIYCGDFYSLFFCYLHFSAFQSYYNIPAYFKSHLPIEINSVVSMLIQVASFYDFYELFSQSGQTNGFSPVSNLRRTSSHVYEQTSRHQGRHLRGAGGAVAPPRKMKKEKKERKRRKKRKKEKKKKKREKERRELWITSNYYI